MNETELLICLIETEINKLLYRQRIAYEKGETNKKKALNNKIEGLKTSLNFIHEIEDMEE